MARKHRVPNNRISNVIGYPQSEANRKYNVPKTALNNYELDLQTGAIPPDTTFEQWRQMQRGVGVATAYKDVNDHLILNFTDGSIVDVGNIKGDDFTYEDFTPQQINEITSSLQLDLTQLKPIASGALPTPSGSGITMKVVGGSVGATWTHATLPSGSASLLKDQTGEFYWNGTSWALTNVVDLPTTPVDGIVAEGDDRAVSGGEVYDFINEINNDTIYLPSYNYVDSTFSSGIGTVSVLDVYFDNRNILKAGEILERVTVRSAAGSLNMVFIKDGIVVHSEPIVVPSGGESVKITDYIPIVKTWNTDVYVGIQNNTVVIRAKQMNGNPNGKKIPYGSTTIESSNYLPATEIEINNSLYNIEDFKFINVLKASDTSKLQRLINSGGSIHLDNKTYIIEETVTIPSGVTLKGNYGTTKLKASPSLSGDIIKIDSSEDVSLDSICLQGNLANYSYSMNGINSGVGIVESESDVLNEMYIGSQNGLNITHSERVVLDKLQFNNLSGVGLILDYVGRNYIHGLRGSNLNFFNNYKGLKTINEAEFYNLTNIMISLCQVGVHFASGNMNVDNINVTRCRVGALFTEGINHAHGILGNAEIKHNQIAGIMFNNVEYGQYITSLYLSFCKIISRNSNKIYIPNPMFGGNASIDYTGGSSNNIKDYFTTAASVNIINAEGLNINRI